MKKPTLKELKAALLDAPKYELDKIYVQAKTLRQTPANKKRRCTWLKSEAS
jgi:hypothetical protein